MPKFKFEGLVEELAATRLRLSRGEWHGEEYTAMTRVLMLERLPLNQTGDELHRHVVVAAIAALQSFHRAVLVTLVGCGAPYEDRAAALVDDKFTLREALKFLGSGTLTAAELIAHTAPTGSIYAMAEALSTILDCDIKQALAGAVEPYSRDNPEAAPIITDIEGLYEQLREAFKLRNILAHEVAPLVFVTAEKAQ